jgi:HEAT repeat protein
MKRQFCIILTSLLLVACQQGGVVDLKALSEKGLTGEPAACRQLVELLGMTENRVGEKVYPVVIEIGEPVVAPLLAAVKSNNREQRERVIAALGTLRVDSAVQPISEVLLNKSLKRRYIAAWALGEIGSAEGIDPLIIALADPDQTVRQYATRSLIKFNRKAVDPLIASLATAEPVAAAGAIRALGDIGDKRALEPLLQQVDGPNRRDVFLALGKLRDARAETALITGLTDDDWRTRMNAAMALGTVGGDRAEPALRRTLEDEVLVVREWSARSLSVVSGQTVRYRDDNGELVEPYSVYH